MNFNSTLNSQEIPDTWTEVDPVTSQKIQSEGKMFSRNSNMFSLIGKKISRNSKIFSHISKTFSLNGKRFPGIVNVFPHW